MAVLPNLLLSDFKSHGNFQKSYTQPQMKLIKANTPGKATAIVEMWKHNHGTAPPHYNLPGFEELDLHFHLESGKACFTH